MTDVTSRALEMLAVLQTGREFTGVELAGRLGVSERTLRRDAERLRELGYGVEARRGPGGGYRLTPGASVPPLVLEEDEAVAVQLGLAMLAAAEEGPGGASGGPRGLAADDGAGGGGAGGVPEAAARAQAKLLQLLPRQLRPRAAAIREALDVGVPSAPAVDAAALSELAQAVHDHLVLGFEHAQAEQTSRRRAEPHRLVHRYARWYLLAWDLDREDWRTFRVDRMRSIAPTGARFVPRRLPLGDGGEQLKQGVRGARLPVELEVSATPGEILDALPYEDLDLEVGDDGRTRVRVHVRDWRWVPHLLAAMPGEARILGPAEVRTRVIGLAEQILVAQTGEARPR
jgi:predicted DNA-binding transcriptional regulator YafY